MTERLIGKLDRLGAEAGIKEMTPEMYTDIYKNIEEEWEKMYADIYIQKLKENT